MDKIFLCQMTILAVPISAMFENRDWLALPWDSKLFCSLKLFVSVLICGP